MSFFGLGDIKFNKQRDKGFGPLSALDEQQEYKYNTFRYPLDVGNYDKGHYMIIYILAQDATKSTAPPLAQDAPLAFGKQTIANSNGNDFAPSHLITKNLATAKTAVNKVNSGVVSTKGSIFNGDIRSFSTDAVVDNSIKKITDKGPGFLRKTTRTTDAIALYMPDTLQFDYSQNYQSQSPGKEILGQAVANAPGVVDKIKDGDFVGGLEGAARSGAGRVLLESLAGATGSGDSARLGLFAATGKVLNPMLEMLYSAPEFRSFQFDFLFYPRSEAEGLEVQKLMERLRYHQAPDLSLNDSGQNDGLLIPPSEFEISFYYGGSENPNIPQIGQCVLEKIQINYAPQGFTAYEVPGENKPTLGRTGMPVAIQMTLNFREITYLTKFDFRKDLPTLTYPS